MLKNFRGRLLVFLSVLGPGFITAMVDNDAGGIFTYSQAGARFGYHPLWTLLPVTLLLIVTQEMCSRMGAVTGKGLSDLIREEFGLRITFLMMAVLLVTNFTNVIANFAGVAESLELFGISRYVAVPLAAIAVWTLVVEGTYESVEKIFLAACVFYISYFVSGVLVHPDWKQAVEYSFVPTVFFDSAYIGILIGIVGTSIAPWMQFYLQAAIVEKGVTVKEYNESRVEVIFGCIVMSVTAFFIMVSCAGAIWHVSPRDIASGADAALGLKPFGEYAFLLFSAGLFNASLFAASIQPLSTAYTICEGLGFEAGVDYRFREAPVFYWLFTLIIVISAAVVLIPAFPLVQMILLSQVLNGVLLPFVLIFMLLLINKQRIMGEWVNSRFYNWVAWISVVVIIALTLALAWLIIADLV